MEFKYLKYCEDTYKDNLLLIDIEKKYGNIKSDEDYLLLKKLNHNWFSSMKYVIDMSCLEVNLDTSKEENVYKIIKYREHTITIYIDNKENNDKANYYFYYDNVKHELKKIMEDFVIIDVTNIVDTIIDNLTTC